MHHVCKHVTDHEKFYKRTIENYNSPYENYFQNCYMRDEILELVDHANMTIGVEVGVQKGMFAGKVLDVWKQCEMYNLVDLWQHQKNYNDTANVDNQEQEENMMETKHRMEVYGFTKRVKYFQMSSTDAAKLFEDKSVDFVYLDARHDYCGVTQDITSWYPKLKDGGIMAGHDFYNAEEAWHASRGNEHWEVCGDGSINEGAVKQAVIDFACRHGIHILHTTEKSFPSWYYSRKPPTT